MIQTALWLDAADAPTVTTVSGAVSQWNDKSGNARHATQATAGNRPAYASATVNGKNTLTFDGSSDSLSVVSGFTLSSFACFAVFEPSAKSNSYIYLIWSTNPAIPQLSLISRYATPGNYEFYQTGTARQVISGSATGQNIAYYERSGSTVTPRFNGGSAITSATVDSADTTVSIHRIGALLESSFTEYYQGIFCELILIGSVPSAGTRQRIEGYLAHKWGLTANLPAGHPYKTIGPTP
jgi:hypothetical protein